MKRLQAYRFTDSFIKEGIDYLTRQIVPERLEFESKRNEFRARYQNMQVKGSNQLYVGERQVIQINEIDDVLTLLYKSIGDIGRDRLYAHVASKYIGISRPRVMQFLNNQELHQLVRPVVKQRVNIAIIAPKPMQRFQADLIDMSKYKSPQNGNTTFCLTIIDCFSKLAWVVALKNKEAATVAAALDTVFSENGAPSLVQTDNGGEFNEEFDEVLARWGVEHARSRPYHPQSNGIIERFNGTLKRMIHAYMLANDTKTYLPKLKEIVHTYNNLLHSGINQIPAQVHKKPALWAKVSTQLKLQAMRSKRRGRQIKRPPLDIGDHVRSALIAKSLEKPMTFWSKEIYRVMSIQNPKHEWEATQYILHDGRKFTRDRLQKVNELNLVHMNERIRKQKIPVQPQKQVPQAPVPRVLPQRERAPTSRLIDSFLDL